MLSRIQLGLALLLALASGACHAPAPDAPPITSALPVASLFPPTELLADVVAQLSATDRGLTGDREQLFSSVVDVLGLLVIFEPATGITPTDAPRWDGVQGKARDMLARLDDPACGLGDRHATGEFNDINLGTRRAARAELLAHDPDLRVLRGVLLDLAGREDEARGWFDALRADQDASSLEPAQRATHQWRAWRAARDGQAGVAATEQAEALRGLLADRHAPIASVEVVAASLGLMLCNTGHESLGVDVLRSLLARSVPNQPRLRQNPANSPPSWGTRLARAELARRGESLEPQLLQLVEYRVPDVGIVAVERWDEHGRTTAHNTVAVSGRLGGPKEPWQTWLAPDAPRPLLQHKAELALPSAQISDLIDNLQVLDALVGSVQPYVDELLLNLARYPSNDNDNVADVDRFLRQRIADAPAAPAAGALYPGRFVELWKAWTPKPVGAPR